MRKRERILVSMAGPEILENVDVLKILIFLLIINLGSMSYKFGSLSLRDFLQKIWRLEAKDLFGFVQDESCTLIRIPVLRNG